jgi:hypothetical protein
MFVRIQLDDIDIKIDWNCHFHSVPWRKPLYIIDESAGTGPMRPAVFERLELTRTVDFGNDTSSEW